MCHWFRHHGRHWIHREIAVHSHQQYHPQLIPIDYHYLSSQGRQETVSLGPQRRTHGKMVYLEVELGLIEEVMRCLLVVLLRIVKVSAG